MKKVNRLILCAVASLGFLFVSNSKAETANTQVVVPDFAQITGMSSTASITLVQTEIESAIAAGTPLVTSAIAQACIFTTHENGDFDMTATADPNYMTGSNFALYNLTLGKIKVDLRVASTNAPTAISLTAGTAKQLTDHSDVNSSGTTCANQVTFDLSIAAADLRLAKAGTYDFAMSTSTSAYSGA